MIKAIFFHEKLNFLRRGPAIAIALLVICSLAYAGWSGDRWRDARSSSLAAFETAEFESLENWRADLVAIENGEKDPSPYEANPMSVSFPAVLPPSSLGDFAIGAADLHPSSGEISPWRNMTSVFGRYPFDNPTTLASSAFDMALVVIVLMPILMIAISFDVLASERSRGSLALVLAASRQFPPIVWTRLAIRNGLLWLVTLSMMVLLALVHDAGGDRFARLGIWLVSSVVYGAFWFALIALCVAHFRSSMGTAGALVGLWLLLTLALPAMLATVSEALHPTPSRLALLSEIRSAQGETNRKLDELTEGFLLDHPDLTVGDESVPYYYRAAFLSNEAARESTGPIVQGYTRARAGRERTIRWTQYLSPPIVAQRVLLKAAGADLGRQHRFQQQVWDALYDLAAAVGPSVVSRNRLSVEAFDQLKPFEFQDLSAREIAAQSAWPLLFLVMLSALLALAAQRRLARIQRVASPSLS